MRNPVIIFLLPLVFTCLTGLSQPAVFKIQQPQESYTLVQEKLEILHDPSHGLGFEEIQGHPGFTPYPDVPQPLKKDGAYWGHITISKHTPGETGYILILGKKRHADYADIYIKADSTGFIHYKGGYFHKASEKPITREPGSKIPFRLQQGQSVELYFCIRNITGFAPDFRPRLTTHAAFRDRISNRNLIQGFIHGFLWLMLLYNLLLFLMSRDKTYLYYSLFILGTAINFLSERGLLLETVLKEHPFWNPYVFVVATGGLSIAYLQFLRKFLNTKTNTPWWDRAHKVALTILAIQTAGLLVILAFGFHVKWMINTSNYTNLLILFYGIAFIGGILKYYRNLLAYYTALATLSLVVGTFVSLYYLTAGIDPGFDPKYFMNAGIIGQMLFFSLGLGYRIRITEKEKRTAQEGLIEQLRRNEELQEKVTRELEEKVRGRTHEIQLQKEEIIAQSERLAEINNELEKLSIVASETDNAVMIMEKDGKVEWVNNGLMRMFGYSKEELASRGSNLFDLLKITDMRAPFEEVHRKKESVTYELPFVHKNENEMWVQTTLTPILDEAGEIRKLIAIGSNITKIKEAETKITRQRDKISRQNKQITDSINYARRIQTAILPEEKDLQGHFADSFIFFLPRDIVSGDFYWFKEVGRYVVLVAADCTGHGVPGAFMSMLSVAYLNEVVQHSSVPQANEILGQLREQIKKSLRQSGNSYTSRDGIDIAFVVYDKAGQKLYFSGAHNPLYLIHKGELHIYKGDRMPVGQSRKERPFSIHEIRLHPGDSFYLFSDGYVDQFGSDNKEKYKLHRFKQTLMDIHPKPMKEQKEILTKAYFDWKGHTSQLDDILVMGLKV